MDRIERTCRISTQDLLVLGLKHVAYVKPVIVPDQRVYAVHAADGAVIAVLPTREMAFAVTCQHGLELLSLQ